MAGLTIPTGPDEITPQWLTEALGSTGTGPGMGTAERPNIVGLQSERLGQGQGFVGQVYRITPEYHAREYGSPGSIVAKLASADPDIRELTFELNQNEHRFYREIAPQVKLPTPHLYYGAEDPDSGKKVLILEDILNVRVGDNVAGCSTTEAKLAFREIAGFHAKWWLSPSSDDPFWPRPITSQPALNPETFPLGGKGSTRSSAASCPRCGGKWGRNSRFMLGPSETTWRRVPEP